VSRDYALKPFRAPVNLQIDYARELNPQQLAAVMAPPGPALVIAGAGAGKTRTLTYRVAYLLEQGVPPECILLLTFTNKAAREMMRRVADLIANDLAPLWGGTFHAMGNRILRRHADRLGLQRDFTILDRDDAADLLSACLDDAGIDLKATLFPKADVLAEVFSLAVNTRQSIAALLARQFKHLEALAPQIVGLQQSYTARKRATGVVDFDDLLALWLQLLEEHPDVREHYQRRFEFILVDEYQDTNQIQSDLIDLLAARHDNIVAVGDDSQSIYSWRGANFRNIFKFNQRHPGTQLYKIETNYRSTPEILNLANAAIAPNLHQYAKQLTPVRQAGRKPGLVVCSDASAQAAFVAQRALELREEGAGLDEMAVLYRSHFHALELQLELTRRNIPFAITSGIRFFEQAHIKDVAAYLKLLCNPRDELAFKRLVKMLPGIGDKGASKLWSRFCAARGPQNAEAPSPAPEASAIPAQSQAADQASGAARGAPRSPPRASLAPVLGALAGAVPKKATAAWAQFIATFAQLQAEPVRSRPADLIQLVLQAQYEEYLQANYTNYRSRLEDIEQLAIFGQQFASLEEFLSQLALLTNLEAEGDHGAQADSERLRLSTVHQAKGLEFAVVFMIMLCEGMFPSRRCTENDESLEEERRLFYVAITRAKNELYLCYPLVRVTRASGAEALQKPSRFLAGLPGELVEEWNLVQPFAPYPAK
jgi:DNA helicase-2/ATP-dependent DNA helicase PcrA